MFSQKDQILSGLHSEMMVDEFCSFREIDNLKKRKRPLNVKNLNLLKKTLQNNASNTEALILPGYLILLLNLIFRIWNKRSE